MILYSCRSRRNLYKWNTWLPRKERDEFYSGQMPNATFDCTLHDRLQKDYPVYAAPARRHPECVLIVHGRGASPKGLHKFFGNLGRHLEGGDWDIRGFTWPSSKGLRWYGASDRRKYAGAGTASLKSSNASYPLRIVLNHLAEQGYERIHLLGHSLGCNVINFLRQPMIPDIGNVVLMSPDILVSQWSPCRRADRISIWVHPKDKSLWWAGPDPRVGRVGPPEIPGDEVPIDVVNPLDVTRLKSFGHDSYPLCADVMRQVARQLATPAPTPPAF